MSDGFTIIHDGLCAALGADAAIIVGKVVSMCADKEQCEISLDYLSSILGVSTDQVRRHIKRLHALGYIEYIPQYGRGILPLFKKGANLPPFTLKKGCKNAKEKVADLQGNNICNNINIIEEKNIIKKDVLNVMKKFIKPSAKEVRAYCEERGNGIDAEQFVDFYEQKGWMVGKNHMKDWRAAVRTWEHRNKQEQQTQRNYGKRNTSTPADAAAAAAVGIALADAERAAGY